MVGFPDRSNPCCFKCQTVPPSVSFSILCGAFSERLWLSRCIPSLLSNPQEEIMERKKLSRAIGGVTIMAMALGWGVTGKAREQSQEPSKDTSQPAPDQQRRKADGELHGRPIETYAVVPGTKF